MYVMIVNILSAHPLIPIVVLGLRSCGKRGSILRRKRKIRQKNLQECNSSNFTKNPDYDKMVKEIRNYFHLVLFILKPVLN